MNRSGDCVSYNTLISDMSKAEELSRAVIEVLDRRLSPNETTYTALIHSLCKQDRIDDAYRVLNEMFVSGFSPSVDTLRDVLRGFLRIGEIRKAFEMHKEMMERPEYGSFWMDLGSLLTSLYQRGLSDEVTYTSLMNAYLDE
ncbi:pentatricopeptide repeat-containing protein, partial [Trifolium medium]|nr:pentatricopeptide repeat-containing protein [Trifolium medium]